MQSPWIKVCQICKNIISSWKLKTFVTLFMNDIFSKLNRWPLCVCVSLHLCVSFNVHILLVWLPLPPVWGSHGLRRPVCVSVCLSMCPLSILLSCTSPYPVHVHVCFCGPFLTHLGVYVSPAPVCVKCVIIEPLSAPPYDLHGHLTKSIVRMSSLLCELVSSKFGIVKMLCKY